MPNPRPIDAMALPRHCGISTFLRLPHITDPKEIDVAILGVPYDGGTAFRPGCRLAPREIRNMSAGIRPYNDALKVDPYEKHRIADYGDISNDPYSIEESFRRIEDGIDELMEADVIPVCVGGDHGITHPILKAIAKKHGPLAVVHIDAHPDTWDTQLGHKVGGDATLFRRALEDNLIIPSKVISVGIRGTTFYEGDTEYGPQKGFRVWTAEEFMSTNISDFKAEIHRIVGNTRCYLTFDIDALDAAAAPGTNTPELGGLTSFQALQILRSLVGLKIVGADIAGVSPPLDTISRITCITAAQLLYEMICII